MKIYNKFVESKKEPSNKNDIWFDGSSWKMYKEGVWRSFTLPIELAKDIEDAVKDLDLSNYLKKTDVDSTLSETSTNPVENRVITERLNNIKTDTPDWNASEGEAGHIKGRSHRINSAHPFPFESWSKRIDEDGNAIYFQTLPPDSYSGCLIRESSWQEENYIFFGTEWKSLYPAMSADIRINYDSEVGDSVLEIKLYRESDPESFLATFINNSLFAYGQEDFVVPIAKEFIPNTIARQNSVDELREETTALWENLDHGTFPNLTAGDLAGRGESVPASFGFRASGGKSIKDGRAYIKSIKGNSVVWNQKVKGFASWNLQGGTIEGNEAIWSASNRTGTLNAYSNTFAQHTTHKYLISADVKASSSNVGLGVYFTNSPLVKHTGSGNYESLAIITNGKGDGIDACYLTDTSTSGYGEIRAKNYRCIDLTQMFQAGNEPTTIDDFQSRVATLGIDMYAYNEGQVIHCNTESIKSIGDNAWDEQWEVGAINQGTGESFDADNNIRSKDYNRIIGGQEYSFLSAQTGALILYDEHYNYVDYWNIAEGQLRVLTIADNAAYFKICLYDYTYKNGTMLRLNHSGWKSNTGVGYQPYWQDILPLPIIRKYFPDGMKKAGSAHDEIRYNKASGKWEKVQRIGSVDLGTLGWWSNNEGRKTAELAYGVFNKVSDYEPANVICAQYPIETYIHVYTNNYGLALSYQEPYLYVTVFDSSNTDVESFKASLQGVMLYYELAEPIVTELDAEDQNFRDYYNVADFGTEQSQSSTPSAPFSADIIYQFNAVDMIREHEIEINELQSIIATMQAQLASLTSNH